MNNNINSFDSPEIESGEEIIDWFGSLTPEKQKQMLEAIASKFIANYPNKRKTMEVLFKENEDGKVEIAGIFNK